MRTGESLFDGQSRALAAAILIVCTLPVLLGCASPAQPGAMTPAIGPGPAIHPIRTIDVRTDGGQETFPLGRSKISSGDFMEALATALEASGQLYAVVDRPGDYHLWVTINDLQQPHFAFPMTVHLVTTWDLTRRGETEPIWTDVISTVYTEPFRVEFFGIKRLRLATEGAARQNIEQAVVEILRHID